MPDLAESVAPSLAARRGAAQRGGQPLDAKAVKQAIAEGEDRLGSTGRLLVRTSGTEPLIRVMAEGEDAKLVAAVVGDIAGVIEQAAG